MDLKLLIKKLIKESDEAVIDFYISKACTLINSHIGKEFKEDFIIATYQNAVIELVCYQDVIKGKDGISSITQGQRSVSYKDTGTEGILIKFFGKRKAKIRLL